jgi:transglutaminase-like putative cysteine protease
MASPATPGDNYRVTALTPTYGDELRQAALWGETEDDGQYPSLLSTHTQLPEGIEPNLYALTMETVADAQSAYDRAVAIAEYLRRNMRYKLDVEYPPVGRDFVSWFVLDSKQGYCSYFASAMAVMGRIAGLPTRYVEGYYARPG